MKSKKIKIISALVCCNIILGNTCSVLAAEKTSEKEEVVYAIMDSDGEVTGIYVVNSFNGGNILDYGDYKSVKNLTGTEPIVQNDDKITLSSNSEKVYYQGDLKSLNIPWNINIHYYIDNQEYSASDIAGMSGKLKIKLSITQNKKCDESFWKGYALQGTIQLDSNKCTNIVANDGTIANVGSNKQISYIILPGKGKDIEITADVKDFEMSGISINGLKLNMNLDIDSSAISSKLSEVKNAAAELDGGAKKLKDGTNELNSGSKTLNEGASDLNGGASNLYNGVTVLNTGIGQIQNALDKLNSNSSTLNSGSIQTLNALITIQKSLDNISINADNLDKLVQSSNSIKNGIDSLVLGLNSINNNIENYYTILNQNNISDINEYINKHNQLINSLGITNTQRNIYNAYISGGESAVINKLSELIQNGEEEASNLYLKYMQQNQANNVIEEYVTEAGKLINTESILKGDIMYISGSNALINGIYTSLDSENGELMKGALTLQSSYKLFNNNINSMANSLNDLTENMSKLKNAIDMLTYNYNILNGGIGDYTNGVNEIVEGYKNISSGSNSVLTGTSALYDGTKNMVSGADSLYTGVQSLEKGVDTMNKGTSEFREKTQDMDSEVENTIETTVNELTGKNEKTISFVSDKNENVDSVLFVMKTPSIEKKVVEEKETTEKEGTSIIKKFLKLFHLN